MAKSLYAIEMDFANASRQANELEQIAQSLSSLISGSFQPCLDGIRSSWKGSNADAYYKKGKIVSDSIARTVSDLRSASATIRRIAWNTYNAERTNYEIAQRRNYNS